jgi:DNA-binding HxlR family transcriptional regulator
VLDHGPKHARHGGSRCAPLGEALGIVGDRWTLPIALALADGPQRPMQLREQLAGISAGVLDRHLQQMTALGLLLRRRFKEMPPRVEVVLTAAGRELLPIANALARWGERNDATRRDA